MKNGMKKFLIFYCVISILLLFCSTNIEENSLSEEGFQRHEVVIRGKHISFILPDEYVHTDESDRKYYAGYLSGCDVDTFKAFYSIQNKKNYFSIEVWQNENRELDFYIKSFFRNWTEQGIVPFIEKKYDANNHIYSLNMVAETIKQKYISSRFEYLTVFGDRLYICRLKTYEPIDSFSYAEKKKRIVEVVEV